MKRQTPVQVTRRAVRILTSPQAKKAAKKATSGMSKEDVDLAQALIDDAIEQAARREWRYLHWQANPHRTDIHSAEEIADFKKRHANRAEPIEKAKKLLREEGYSVVKNRRKKR